METCKYGSGADKRKPTAVKRKGVVYRAYKEKFSSHVAERQHTTLPNSVPYNLTAIILTAFVMKARPHPGIASVHTISLPATIIHSCM